jgi:hypothetical protein
LAADAITLWRSLIVGGKVRTMRGNPTKTVAVIRFEATDGRPIAVYCNYAVHAVLNGQLDQVSGDKAPESSERCKYAAMISDVLRASGARGSSACLVLVAKTAEAE